MRFIPSDHIRVHDSAKNKNGVILHLYELAYQQQFTTVASTTYAGAYVATPALNQGFALIGYDDLTLAIQTLDKLQIIA